MTEIKEVCGFLDKNGNFHKNRELAEQANARVELKELENQMIRVLNQRLPPRISTDRLAFDMINYPDKYLKILWQVAKFKFKKGFDETDPN